MSNARPMYFSGISTSCARHSQIRVVSAELWKHGKMGENEESADLDAYILDFKFIS